MGIRAAAGKASKAPPAQRAGWLLAAGSLAGGVLILLAMRATEMTGDEVLYAANARALGRWLAGDGASAGAVFAEIAGRGWFMPGMALLGAPLFAVLPDAPNWLAFAWIGAVNGVLLAALLHLIAPIIGARYSRLFLLFPALAPLWLVGAISFLPDLPAGLLLTIAMTLAFRIGLSLLSGGRPQWRLIAGLQACLLAALYLRGPVLIAATGLNLILLALALSLPQQRCMAARIAAGMLMLAAGLAPWSIAVSRHFEAPVVTTTNFPLVIADGFGERDRICFGPCKDGVDIIPAWEFAETHARAAGVHPFAVQRAMMSFALEGIGPRDYLVKVRDNFGRFLFAPANWLRQKMRLSFAVPQHLRATLTMLALVPTLVLYLPFLTALIALNVLPVRRSDSLTLQAIIIKGMTACLFLQPFLHKSSARYWIGFAAMATWAAIVLWQARREGPDNAGTRRMPRWLDHMQAAYGAGFALVAAAILLA